MIMCVQVVGFDMVIYNHDYFTLFSLLYPTKVGLSLACDGMGDLDVRKWCYLFGCGSMCSTFGGCD